MEQIRLQTLVTEVSKALQATQIMMEQTKLEHFLSYFTEKDNTSLPRTIDVTIGIPECGERKEGKFSIPLATLVSHRALSMDTVEVKINTALDFADDGLMAQVGSMERKEIPGGDSAYNQCEIKLVFRNEEPPDGLQEAENLLNKSI